MGLGALGFLVVSWLDTGASAVARTTRVCLNASLHIISTTLAASHIYVRYIALVGLKRGLRVPCTSGHISRVKS
jgi:hypothetical protein